jgi:chemotaxis protein MotB
MKFDEMEKVHEAAHVNPFYISFSDLMVLLCVFFVLILGMSKIEIGSFEKMKTGITGDIRGTLVELHSRLQLLANPQNGVSIEMAKDGVRVDLDTAILFDTASSVLKKDSLASVKPVLKEILGTSYQIDVEGHTDDVPLYKVYGETRESNWSLSGLRAASMVHFLQELGFPDSRLRLVGYASTQPRLAPDGMRGPDLERARAQNRRVSLLVR